MNGEIILVLSKATKMDRNNQKAGSESAMTAINHHIMSMHGLSSTISQSTTCLCVIYLPLFNLALIIPTGHLQKLLMSLTDTVICLPVLLLAAEV